MKPYLIGVAGPSGSGKSELSRWLARQLNAPIVSFDSYYRELSHLSEAERAQTNFDEPASIDEELLLDHLRKLTRGEPVEIPHYDFARHTRVSGTDPLLPGDVVVLEGLFTLYWHELRELLGTSVYVDLEDEVCFHRRLERDVRERGRTAESVRWQYETTVRPMAEAYILPTKRHADVIVRGDWQLDESVAAVLAHRAQK